jgi:ABC-type transport system substrate-binding protein
LIGDVFEPDRDFDERQLVRLAAERLPVPVDRVVVRTIKDTSAQVTALRTGKLDILELVNWSAVSEIKRSAPAR